MAFVPKLNKKKTNDITIDEKMIDNALKRIKNGVPHKIACKAAGFGYTTFCLLIRQGDLDLEAKLETRCSKLVKKLNEQYSEHIERLLFQIENSEKGHTGAQWSLSRKYWQYFSDRAEILQLSEEMEELREQSKPKGSGE